MTALCSRCCHENGADFFVSQIGQVDEVLRVKGQRLRKMLTDRVPRDRNYVLVIEAMKNEARVLARVADMTQPPSRSGRVTFRGDLQN